MTLTALKTALSTLTGTTIGEVFFDWQIYLNEKRSKTYPCVLWMLDGAEFSDDYRTDAIQKTKIFTLSAYAIASFNANSQDKLTEWDTLEGKVKTYLNAMNANSSLQILNISEVKGQYVGEGLISADQEIGINYRNVQIKMYC